MAGFDNGPAGSHLDGSGKSAAVPRHSHKLAMAMIWGFSISVVLWGLLLAAIF